MLCGTDRASSRMAIFHTATIAAITITTTSTNTTTTTTTVTTTIIIACPVEALHQAVIDQCTQRRKRSGINGRIFRL